MGNGLCRGALAVLQSRLAAGSQPCCAPRPLLNSVCLCACIQEPPRLERLRKGTAASSVTGIGVEVSFTEGMGVEGSMLKVRRTRHTCTLSPVEAKPCHRWNWVLEDWLTCPYLGPAAGQSELV